MATGDLNGSGFKFRAIRGNIFYSVNCSLAHCISQDVAMSKGIAASFCKNFVGIVDEIKAQDVKVGGVAVVDRRDGHFVFNLVTKLRCTELPTYSAFTASLRALKEEMEKRGVRRLAIPRLGCGLDKLKWEMVRGLIIEVFAGSSVHIMVYIPLGSYFTANCRNNWHWRPEKDEPETDCFRTQSQRHREIFVDKMYM
jgi:hypothetical protein